jgi:hypothetical protein
MRTKKLEELNPCFEGLEWVKAQKSIEDAWNNCERGEWMLWLAKKLDVDDRLLSLAKATCANQVRHLMKDQRSLDTIDACFRYGKGEISREELDVFAFAAAASYAAAASADAAYSASAADGVYAAAAASYASASYASADYAAAAASYASASYASADYAADYAAAAASYASASYASASYASADATASYAAASYASYASYHAAAASYTSYHAAAKFESLKKSADICREIFKDVVIKKYKNIKIKR